MKSPILKMPEEQARKELKQFLIIGCVCTAVSLFAFGFLAIVGIGFGARCAVLAQHEGIKKHAKYQRLRSAAILLLLVISVLSFIANFAQ